jgi:hypothetical protein
MYVSWNLLKGRFLKMKRKAFFVLWLLSAFGFVSVGLYAQSNEEAKLVGTCEEPKLVGTWKAVGSGAVISNGSWIWDGKYRIMAFNSNGTGTWDGKSMIFGAFGGKIAIVIPAGDRNVYDYLFSKDGKTLILSEGDGSGLLLQKQN